MNKRIAYFDASWPVLLDALKTRTFSAVESSLPADAEVHHLVLFHETQQVRVFFTSEALTPVPEAGTIPEFQVVFRRLDAVKS